MENIKLDVNRVEDNYTLKLDSRKELKIESLKLYVLGIEEHESDQAIIYLDLMDNDCYKTQDIGAYKNVIYINLGEKQTPSVPKAEIRLSLKCLQQEDIRSIFLRVKK